MKIYCDGIFDLFHVGHIESLKYIKNLYSDVTLIVGIISDKDAELYKRKPIICENHRKEMLLGCRYVDLIVESSPLIITQKFIEEHKIDLVVHSFSNKKDFESQKEFFEIPIKLGKFEQIPYSTFESTTNIIERIHDRVLNK
jgi:cytidyltransferase-like protein